MLHLLIYCCPVLHFSVDCLSKNRTVVVEALLLQYLTIGLVAICLRILRQFVLLRQCICFVDHFLLEQLQQSAPTQEDNTI